MATMPRTFAIMHCRRPKTREFSRWARMRTGFYSLPILISAPCLQAVDDTCARARLLPGALTVNYQRHIVNRFEQKAAREAARGINFAISSLIR